MIRNIANLCAKKPFTPNFTKYRNSDENKRFSMRITSTTTIMNGFGKTKTVSIDDQLQVVCSFSGGMVRFLFKKDGLSLEFDLVIVSIQQYQHHNAL